MQSDTRNPRGLAFYRELLGRLRTLPRVQSASVAAIVPLIDDAHVAPLEVPGYVPRRNEVLHADVDAVSPGFFDTMRISLVAGRGFTDRDEATATCVGIINEAMAARFQPGQDPLNRTFVEHGTRDDVIQIVAISRNSCIDDPFCPIGPAFYIPFAQGYSPDQTVQIRTAAAPEAIAADVAAIVRSSVNFDFFIGPHPLIRGPRRGGNF